MEIPSEQVHGALGVETIFPLNPQKIDSYLKVFSASSERMLSLVQAARGDAGAEASVYHHIPLAELAEWHKKEKDFTGGDIYYKMGVLYGHDVAQYMVRTHAGSNLLFDNDDAFAQAMQYTKATYRGLDDKETGWRRQKLRELRYTGSDVLSIAAATRNDFLRERLPVHLDALDVDDTLAFHVGLVDGAILTDAYHAYKHDRKPRVFDKKDQHAYAPLLGVEHIAPDTVDGSAGYQFKSSDFLKNVKGMSILNDTRRLGISALQVARSAMIYGRNVIVQTAPNLFQEMTEAKAVLHIRYGLGAASLRGALLGGSYVLGDVVAGPLMKGVPLSALATLGVVGAEYFGSLHGAKKFAREHRVPIGHVFPSEYNHLVVSAETVEQVLLRKKVEELAEDVKNK